MIKGWTNVDLRQKFKGDLEYKLSELDKVPWNNLNEEEKALRNEIVFVLDNPDSDSDSTFISPTDSIDSYGSAPGSAPKASTSVEDNLDTLGSIVIVLGSVFGSILILFGMMESFFIAIWGFAGILSALISGYILKGLSKIISLLSSLQNTNSDDQ